VLSWPLFALLWPARHAPCSPTRSVCAVLIDPLVHARVRSLVLARARSCSLVLARARWLARARSFARVRTRSHFRCSANHSLLVVMHERPGAHSACGEWAASSAMLTARRITIRFSLRRPGLPDCWALAYAPRRGGAESTAAAAKCAAIRPAKDLGVVTARTWQLSERMRRTTRGQPRAGLPVPRPNPNGRRKTTEFCL
jgi:hypothetical protein